MHLVLLVLEVALSLMTPRKLLAWLTSVCPLAGIASSLLLSDFFSLSKLVPKRLDYRESFSFDKTFLH